MWTSIRRTSLALALLLLSGSGCALFTRYIPVEGRYPIIETPKMGELSVIKMEDLDVLDTPVREKLLANIVTHRTYIQQIDAAVDAYNQAAKVHNDALLKETSDAEK